jgi:Tat protein secretion system quality control protein TatD with DNase activity
MKMSHPGMVLHVAAQIACLRNMELKDVIAACYENTRTFYKIPSPPR